MHVGFGSGYFGKPMSWGGGGGGLVDLFMEYPRG